MAKYSGYNESRKKATLKYKSAHLDSIRLDVRRGKKDVYKAYAESKGKSLTRLFIDLVEEDMRKNGFDTGEPEQLTF